MVEDFTNKTILIVGLGLMGGSIAKALKGKNTGAVWAIDSNPQVLAQAKSEGTIALGFENPSEAVSNADFIIVCLYPELAVDFINNNMESFKSGATITDICGVKKPVIDKVKITRSDIDFVPAHPMAGSERQGYSCSRDSLFKGCNYIVTPLESNSQDAIGLVSSFTKLLGAKNIVMASPSEHDEYIAYTSQIPHALAVAYMHSSKERDITSFAGGSFRDVSRVALINEVMWAELFNHNDEKLLAELKALQLNLAKITELIENKDLQTLKEYMKRGATIKERYDATSNS